MTPTPPLPKLPSQWDEHRAAFEADAGPLGFDLTRSESITGEPWMEYAEEVTGHRFAGFIAALSQRGEAVAQCYERVLHEDETSCTVETHIKPINGYRPTNGALLFIAPQPAQPNAEALIRACIPGGSSCDPQQVADSIRRYLDQWPSGDEAQPAKPAPMTEGDVIDKLGDAIENALDERDVTEVLSALSGSLVGLVVELTRRAGHDISKQITLDGGAHRDITIGAVKPESFHHIKEQP